MSSENLSKALTKVIVILMGLMTVSMFFLIYMATYPSSVWEGESLMILQDEVSPGSTISYAFNVNKTNDSLGNVDRFIFCESGFTTFIDTIPASAKFKGDIKIIDNSLIIPLQTPIGETCKVRVTVEYSVNRFNTVGEVVESSNSVMMVSR